MIGCSVYGISSWDLNLDNSVQKNLIITKSDQPTITVDNIELAQFIYLMINNDKLRDIIDTITSKVVLILGNFSPERKIILDEIREKLRHHNYIPLMFDFEKPLSRNFTETIQAIIVISEYLYRLREIELMVKWHTPIIPSREPNMVSKKIRRNDPCPCGSGKKYKKCCLGKVFSNNDN